VKPQIGIWIDPHQAILVTNPEHHADISRVVAAHAPQENAYARASRYQEAATAEAFYDDVVDHLRDASALLLVGPGAAKFDLQERLVAHGLGDLIWVGRFDYRRRIHRGDDGLPIGDGGAAVLP